MSKSNSKTYTTSEIAKHLGVNTSTVTRFAQKHNILPVAVTQNNAKHYYIHDFDGLHKKSKSIPTKPKETRETVLIEQLEARLQEKQNQINDLRNSIEVLQHQLNIKDEQISTANRLIDQAQQLDLTTHNQKVLPEKKVQTTVEEPGEKKKSFWAFWRG